MGRLTDQHHWKSIKNFYMGHTCLYPENTQFSCGEQSARLAAHIGENGQKPEPTSYVSAECQEEMMQYA